MGECGARDMSEFWRGRRVLVTGGAGFLGSFVVKCLREREKAEVFVPRSREYDLTLEEAVRKLYADFPAEIVVHLAARVGGIGANQKSPGQFFYDNLMMGALLMEHARLNNVAKFVQVGTICSYPKIVSVPFREEDLWNGYPEETNAPYGIAKKALMVQGQAYRRQYGFKAVNLLQVNLYGPGDNFDPESSHVIPALIRRFAEAKASGAAEVVLWGSGNPTREFLYVEDAAEGIALATEKLDKGDPVNLGSGFEVSIRELAEMIRHLIGFAGDIRWDRTRPDGQPRRLLDVSKAKELFGFSAHTPFEIGLRRTVDWYLSTRSDLQPHAGRASD